VAVNVSRRQLATPGLAEFIEGELMRAGVPGQALIVEVTESLVMGSVEDSAQVLHTLREAGVGAAIDDFGTGYSSLSQLRRLPVEFLKIDKSFVADADVSPESLSIIGAIVAMAHGLGLKAVAEGVERQGQVDVLRELGCDIGQGYWFARPQPPDQLRSLLLRGALPGGEAAPH
jgi:EAL domain-containing protein (putative c-di-GMP-specific phosphodiesterase class I)